MNFSTVLYISFSLAAAVSAIGVQFLDCPGNDGTLGLLRRCCRSDELPKDCECYDISSSTDYTNTAFQKPQCPADINVVFHLYSRQHRTTSQRIQSGETRIKSTSFSGAKKTVFIAHGFTDNGNNQWVIAMKNALLDVEDLNVIAVDWQQGAKGPNYYQAAANTRMVGSMVARLIQDLHSFGQAGIGNFHLVGHSLGAHLLGYAGKEVFRLTNQKVGRITGMDPAGPAFESYSSYVRIDSSDAQFVDIIHTDAEPLINAGFGIRGSIGHVDFYPNGGIHQPGCPAETFGLLSMVNFSSQKDGGACSHGRVLDLFTNSIQRCRYNPPDGNTACTMGYHVSRSCRGDHSPVTTDKAPFC
ncbi:pancreatic triacylglycerol lipase-like isoform X1 [Biomphalaria pfeifferi]|uniref:Pancreatic triacylglycerol lipase-like isoform X1 n=1 Tax=Biomphalaria pfeifferi TaxID=112525 RepID=A0AAD8CBI1_BIOPF|nr:pancreatic triacylglycerol lipase-like isoform X1 [Biomphalaria pfeifferi]